MQEIELQAQVIKGWHLGSKFLPPCAFSLCEASVLCEGWPRLLRWPEQVGCRVGALDKLITKLKQKSFSSASGGRLISRKAHRNHLRLYVYSLYDPILLYIYR